MATTKTTTKRKTQPKGTQRGLTRRDVVAIPAPAEEAEIEEEEDPDALAMTVYSVVMHATSNADGADELGMEMGRYTAWKTRLRKWGLVLPDVSRQRRGKYDRQALRRFALKHGGSEALTTEALEALRTGDNDE